MSNLRPEPGPLSGAGLRVAVVASRYNENVVERLLSGADTRLERLGVSSSDRELVRVAGAWEIPQLLEVCARTGRFDALVALGAVIRGDTPHFDLVANECSRGCSEVGLRHALAVGFGVLACDNLEQALARSSGGEGNKGDEAVLAAISTAREIERVRAR